MFLAANKPLTCLINNLFTITGAQKYHVTSGSSKALRKGHLHVRPFAQCIADHYEADVPLR